MPVQCFFVLTGFLIARKTYSIKSSTSPVREYRKLLGVVAPGVLFAAFLMTTGLMFHLRALNRFPYLSFVKDYNNFNVTLKSLISNIFYYPFFEGCVYVGPFWTIKYELLGAIIVAAFSRYVYEIERKKINYILFSLMLLFVSPNILSCVIGAFAYDCVSMINEDNSLVGRIVKRSINNKVIRIVVTIIAFYLLTVNRSTGGIYSPLKYIPLIGSVTFRAIGCAILLVVIPYNECIQSFLSTNLLVWLGSISAYTYAFHWTIILSVGCGMYMFLYDFIGNTGSVFVVTLAVITFTLLVAYIYKTYFPKIYKYIHNCVKNLLPFLTR